MVLTDIKVGLAEAMNSVTDTLSGSLSFLKDMKETSIEKLSTLVNDILGLSPLIEQTGFCMKEFSLDIGIPPGIHITFLKEKETDEQAVEQMLEENKEKEMLRFIVRALQKADSAQKAISMDNYKFRGVNLKVGFPPDMSLKFSKD